jgi:hypothetical protein
MGVNPFSLKKIKIKKWKILLCREALVDTVWEGKWDLEFVTHIYNLFRIDNLGVGTGMAVEMSIRRN